MIREELRASLDAYIKIHYEEMPEVLLSKALEEDNYADEEMICSSPVSPKSRQCSMPMRTLDSLVQQLDETFSEMLLRLIDQRGLKDSEVYKKANIDRRHFSKIRNDTNYVPTKRTVMAFIIALELSMDEAKDLLRKAGYAFSNSNKFDVIISFFIEQKEFNLMEINEVLDIYGQMPLI